eukprot:2781326-Pyramimonas_sp.AAC.1
MAYPQEAISCTSTAAGRGISLRLRCLKPWLWQRSCWNVGRVGSWHSSAPTRQSTFPPSPCRPTGAHLRTTPSHSRRSPDWT